MKTPKHIRLMMQHSKETAMRKLVSLLLLSACQAGYAAPLACLIEPGKMAEVGTPGIGIIGKIQVERGDFVKEGQVIALLKADVERASVDVASARAQSKGDVEASTAAHNLARLKMVRTRDLFDVGFVSKEALDQTVIETQIARSRLEQAREAQTISKSELAFSNSQVAQRRILSPFSGVIVDRLRTEGERVEREPIVRLAQIDPLRVELVMPASQFGQIKLGSKATIKSEVIGPKPVQASVVLIDKIIDAASNTFRVRLSLPNPDHSIPAGLRCSAEFDAVLSATEPPAKANVATKAETGTANVALKLQNSLSLQKKNPSRSGQL